MIRFERLKPSPTLLVYVVLFLAFLLRLWYWRDNWNAPLVIVGDEASYFRGGVLLSRGLESFWSADSWVSGGGYWLLPPLYMVSLGVVIKFLGEDYLAIRLFQVLVGVFIVTQVYRLGRVLFDRRIGLGAAFLATIFFPLVTLPVLVMTEDLFVPLLLGAFILLVEFVRRAETDRRGAAVRLFAAGFVLALATLTRAVPTLFFPLVLLWLVPLLKFKWREVFRYAAVFAVGAWIVFGTWGVRNYLLYDRILLTDTMGAENLWYANVTKDESSFGKIPNPVDRQSVAVEESLRRIGANPARLVEGIIPNARHVFRLEVLYSLSADRYDEDAAQFVRDLILDDGIFLLTMLFATIGLVYARDARTRWLWVLWLVYNLVMLVSVFPSSVRYRLPHVPLLMPFAVYGVREIGRAMRDWRPKFRVFSGRAVAAVALCLAIFAVAGWGIPERLVQIRERDSLIESAMTELQQGKPALAAQRLEQAKQVDPKSARVPLALGDYYRATNDSSRAIEAYRQAIRQNRDSWLARLRLGDLYRARGDDGLALQTFSDVGDRELRMQDWAWDHPELFAGAPSRVDVGALDTGYVRWMFPRDRIESDEGDLTFRWTGRLSQVRLFPQPDGARILSMHLAGYRPEEMPRPYVNVVVNGQRVARFLVRRVWQVYNFKLPPELAQSKTLTVTLQSDVWVAAAEGQISPPPPRLGVQLDWVQVGNTPMEGMELSNAR